MLFTIRSFCFDRLAYFPVEIQIDMRIGLGLKMIGSQNRKLHQSLAKIKAALLNSGLRIPGRRVLINFESKASNIHGAHLELGMAFGLMMHPITKGNPRLENSIDNYVFIGQIEVDGSIKHSNSFFNFLEFKRKTEVHDIPIIAEESEVYCKLIPNMEYVLVKNLKSLRNQFYQSKEIKLQKSKSNSFELNIDLTPLLSIQGQDQAKRASLIAAIGKHHILYKGPPGIGKSLMAKALATLFKNQNDFDLIESLNRRTEEGHIDPDTLRNLYVRELNIPATKTSLIGGGSPMRLGDLPLAHKGILLIEDLQDLSRPLLNRFKYILEEQKVLIGKGPEQIALNTDFQLIASMNPKDYKCEYKLSQALAERIDISVFMDLEAPNIKEQNSRKQDRLKQDLINSLAIQKERNSKFNIRYNHEIPFEKLDEVLELDRLKFQELAQKAEKLKLSKRGFHKSLKVARSIADLQQSKHLSMEHFYEALHFRWHKKSL